MPHGAAERKPWYQNILNVMVFPIPQFMGIWRNIVSKFFPFNEGRILNSVLLVNYCLMGMTKQWGQGR
jgi:hypothetical protein